MKTCWVYGKETSDDGITVGLYIEPDQVTKVVMSKAALSNRMDLYRLKTEDDALVAIIKEQVTRICQLPAAGSDDNRIAAMGGLRDDVVVNIGVPPDGVPAPPILPKPAKQALAEALNAIDFTGATTLAEVGMRLAALKAAMEAYAKS